MSIFFGCCRRSGIDVEGFVVIGGVVETVPCAYFKVVHAFLGEVEWFDIFCPGSPAAIVPDTVFDFNKGTGAASLVFGVESDFCLFGDTVVIGVEVIAGTVGVANNFDDVWWCIVNKEGFVIMC